jgi:hypothetical protein
VRIESEIREIRCVVVCRNDEESKALGEFIIRMNALGVTSMPESSTPAKGKVAHTETPKEKQKYGDAKSKSDRFMKAEELIKSGKTAEEAAVRVWGHIRIGNTMGKLRKLERNIGKPQTKAAPVPQNSANLEPKIIDYLKDGPAKPIQIKKFVGGSENEIDNALHELRLAGKVTREGGRYMIKGWEPKEEPEEDDNEAPESELHPGNNDPKQPLKKMGRPRSAKNEEIDAAILRELVETLKGFEGKKDGISMSEVQIKLSENGVPDYKISRITTEITDPSSELAHRLSLAHDLKISTYRGDSGEKMFLVEAAK